MKTSLMIDDQLFRAARREAQVRGRSLGETISYWARVGYETLKKTRNKRRATVKGVDLGGPAQVDVNCRREWLEDIET